MTTHADVIEAARRYLGVPWRHQARSIAGVDCAGLLIVVAHELGLSNFDTSDYGRIPDGVMLRSLCDEHMDRCGIDEAHVYLMRFQHNPQHIAIVTDKGIIHAYMGARKVVEHSLDAVWRSRIVQAYRIRGIE